GWIVAHPRADADCDDAGERSPVSRGGRALRGAHSRCAGNSANRRQLSYRSRRTRPVCAARDTFHAGGLGTQGDALADRRLLRGRREMHLAHLRSTMTILATRRALVRGLGAYGALAGITVFCPPPARAQARPVRIVVPFAPGGGADLIARMLQPHLQLLLGQSF